MLQQIAFAALLALTAGNASAEILPEQAGDLHAGELLFKGADTAVGTRLAADWSLGDKRWGHIGIVVEGDTPGTLSVIHADTLALGQTGEVRKVSLREFLSDVEDLGVYEVTLEGDQRAAYLLYAESAIGRPFDRSFSLKSDKSLYCSELVWRALSAGAGKDVVPDKTARLGRVYVSVSDIADNPVAHELRQVSARQ